MAKEGLNIISCFAILGLTGIGVGWSQSNVIILFVGCLMISFALFSIYFFRDPIRIPTEERNAIISPADGKVIRITEERNGSDRCTRISIFMSVWDVHVNRAPISGTIEAVRYYPGRFHTAWRDKASLDNEQVHIDFKGKHTNMLIQIRLIAGLVARRVVCHVSEGDYVRAGERIGIIKFGSRAEVYLPEGIIVAVKQGHKVRAGESVLGYFAETKAVMI